MSASAHHRWRAPLYAVLVLIAFVALSFGAWLVYMLMLWLLYGR